MLEKDMRRYSIPPLLGEEIEKAKDLATQILPAIIHNLDNILEASRSIISIPRSESCYFAWARRMKSKGGFSFEKRFDFWAQTRSGMSGVAFISRDRRLVFPIYRRGLEVVCINLVSGITNSIHITELMPLFPRAITAGQTDANTKRLRKLEKEMMASICNHRDSWLNNTETTTIEREDMKQGMINVNKEALKQIGYLNAGRASNKLIKEAARPLLNVMFKPTFMQKVAMKIFKMENPVDVALKSGISDLVCAQLVHAIVEIKGVENPYVRQVTQAGITQSGYELSKAIPFEEAVDKLVKHLEEGAESIVTKISKK